MKRAQGDVVAARAPPLCACRSTYWQPWCRPGHEPSGLLSLQNGNAPLPSLICQSAICNAQPHADALHVVLTGLPFLLPYVAWYEWLCGYWCISEPRSFAGVLTDYSTYFGCEYVADHERRPWKDQLSISVVVLQRLATAWARYQGCPGFATRSTSLSLPMLTLCFLDDVDGLGLAVCVEEVLIPQPSHKSNSPKSAVSNLVQ